MFTFAEFIFKTLFILLFNLVFLFTSEKAIENFAWNVRMLRGQSDLLRQAKKDCLEDIRQVITKQILKWYPDKQLKIYKVFIYVSILYYIF